MSESRLFSRHAPLKWKAQHAAPQPSETSDLSTHRSALNSRRLHSGDQRVRETSFHVRVIAVRMPCEIILLHALGQLWILLLNFQSRFEPMPAGGDAIHAFLIEIGRASCRERV